MKKLIYKANSYWLLVMLAAFMLTQSSCKKESSSSTGTPVIKSIRNYVASPGDSLLHKVGTGQWVVVSGSNLKGALQIYFDGVNASFNDAWFSDTSAVVLIPAVIAFPSVPSTQLNTIRYVTTHGETTFSFPIVAPAPTISNISNEDANVGDSVKIYGFSFFFIKSVTYAGVPITSYKGANDGTSISFVVPTGVTQTGGIVSVVTQTGATSTVYSVHNLVNGVLNNYDNVNNFSWGSGTSNSSSAYPGNAGYYGVLSATNMNAYDYGWYNYPHSINCNGAQWVPVANLSSTVDSYALKFEISVTTPWSAGSLYILKDYSTAYQALYRPWQNADGTTKAFTTKGWTTVTIPLSNFVDSKGFPPASLTALLGSGGNGSISFWFENDSANKVVAFEAAVDNMRIVKIK